MRINKDLICFFAIVLIIVGVCVYALSYTQTHTLCTLIEKGDTDQAIQTIAQMRDVNKYSAPLWSRRLINATENDIELPLVLACKEGNLEVVEALLSKGADPNKYLDGNWSPIEATFLEGCEQRFKIAEKLIEYGADVNLYGGRQSALFAELSLMMYKKEIGERERKTISDSVNLLLSNNATTLDEQGNSIAHYFCHAGETDLLNDVMIYNVDLNHANKRGETPIMWAIKGDSVKSVDFLLELGVDCNTKDNSGKSPLDYAKESGNQKIIKLISEQSGDSSLS